MKERFHLSPMSKKEKGKLNGYRLNEDELLDKSHFPVLMVMNMVSKNRLLGVFEAISKGTGFGEEYGACTLPDDLDEFDKASGEELDGVEFSLYSGEEITIDHQTFLHYLEILCDQYVKEHRDQADIVRGFLVDYSRRFLDIND